MTKKSITLDAQAELETVDLFLKKNEVKKI